MDLRHLEHVLLLADELNFSRAAERAHLTQSAFSRSIQTAEALAGVPFFDRTRRSVQPTAVGLRIIERGRRILAEASDLDREIRFLETGVGGEVRVGAGLTQAASILPDVAQAFHRQYPQVKLTFQVGHWSSLVDDLLHERIDFLISDVSELDAQPGLEITRLLPREGSLFCRAGHPLLQGPVSRERLAAFEFAGPPLPTRIAPQMASLIDPVRQRENLLAIECNSMGMLRRLTLESDLILINLVIAVAREVEQGLLVDLKPLLPAELADSLAILSQWGLARPAGRTQSPAAVRFMALLEAACQLA
ncbi:LysR family transcriptional regulator [Pseudomonas sp. N040]|uniref:LysR family transcriptional regulator n=1 Tax=Pseudomonas sp. N040 TaxID=2785325 RepID=UPI0018A25F76|nr:LysR family transcriptional regulator [Pseudomonas sp. N040]MBF7729439.1 LysR family transcriptional regulator [Pseudomonas sp. N040]MBW7013079.1 LysR family transcriptional regulator [Pseudomonas sp. N040]